MLPLITHALTAWAATTGQAQLMFTLDGDLPLDGFGTQVAVGDFDADGFDDLAVSLNRPGFDTPSEVRQFRGSATGLDPVAVVTLPAGSLVHALQATDLDGDGDSDLAVFTRDAASVAEVQLFAGGPGGLAAAPTTTLPMGDLFPVSMFAADLNGDGAAEVVLQLVDGQTWLIEGHPDLAGAVTALPDVAPAGVRPLGDLDGDGFYDFALADNTRSDWWHTVWQIAFGSATGPVPPTQRLIDSHPSESFFSVGDLDGDGAVELGQELSYSYLPSTDDAQLAIYLGGAHTRDAPPVSGSVMSDHELMILDGFGCGTGPSADYSGDGVLDVTLISCVSPTLHAFLGDPAAPLTVELSTLDNSVEGFGWTALAAGDLDGDGVHELIVGDPEHGGDHTGRVWVFSLADGPPVPTDTGDTGTPATTDTSAVVTDTGGAPTSDTGVPDATEPTQVEASAGDGCGCESTEGGLLVPQRLLSLVARRSR